MLPKRKHTCLKESCHPHHLFNIVPLSKRYLKLAKHRQPGVSQGTLEAGSAEDVYARCGDAQRTAAGNNPKDF